MPLRVFLVLAGLIATGAPVFGDQTATTADGKKVLLRDNGTWEYVRETPAASSTPIALGHAFRQAAWGASRETVKATETATLLKEASQALGYSGEVAGLPCVILYVFVADHLVRGNYGFMPQHSNPNHYIDDYERVKKFLVHKYGPPEGGDERIWRGEPYENDPAHWGMAVLTGELIYQANWETPGTEILLRLSGDNYKPDLTVQYRSRAFGHLEAEVEQRRARKDF